jgi:phytoene dehydrogenase-like protein
MSDSSLAPSGHHVVSILVHYAAYDLEGGWTRERTRELGSRVVETLCRVCPSVGERIVGAEVLSPADIEKRYGLTNGHIFHGEPTPDQLLFMRPTIECSRYATPIPGLFLCGSGSHPGGGITCGPGYLGAKAILG